MVAGPAAPAGLEAARVAQVAQVAPVAVQEDFPVKDQCVPALTSRRRAVNVRRRPLVRALTSCRQKCASATDS